MLRLRVVYIASVAALVAAHPSERATPSHAAITLTCGRLTPSTWLLMAASSLLPLRLLLWISVVKVPRVVEAARRMVVVGDWCGRNPGLGRRPRARDVR